MCHCSPGRYIAPCHMASNAKAGMDTVGLGWAAQVPAKLSRQSARPLTLWSWVRAPRWVLLWSDVLCSTLSRHVTLSDGCCLSSTISPAPSAAPWTGAASHNRCWRHRWHEWGPTILRRPWSHAGSSAPCLLCWRHGSAETPFPYGGRGYHMGRLRMFAFCHACPV